MNATTTTRRAMVFAAAVLSSGLACSGADKPAPNEGQPTPEAERADAPTLPETLFNYANPEIPAHFYAESERFHGQLPLMDNDNTPASNQTTDAGATLGRVLFYDRNLSSNRTVSCGSCHIAQKGFSDPRVLSIGFEGGETGRHSMGLTNARFYGEGRFFWDQRAATLEAQVLMPFQDPVEMGMTLQQLESRATEADYYPALFEAAFGDAAITSERMSLALAQFVRSMVSTASKYDQGRAMVARRSDDFPNFSEQENFGKSLFVNRPPDGGLGCFTCHRGEGFVAQSAQTNGLDASPADLGYGGVTDLLRDMGTFKVPSLRNVAVRAPFMHDGRFASLEAVLDHYSEGVEDHPNLVPPLSHGPQENMTKAEKDAVVAFLRTLTDTAMLGDPKFSDPFVISNK